MWCDVMWCKSSKSSESSESSESSDSSESSESSKTSESSKSSASVGQFLSYLFYPYHFVSPFHYFLYNVFLYFLIFCFWFLSMKTKWKPPTPQTVPIFPARLPKGPLIGNWSVGSFSFRLKLTSNSRCWMKKTSFIL